MIGGLLDDWLGETVSQATAPSVASAQAAIAAERRAGELAIARERAAALAGARTLATDVLLGVFAVGSVLLVGGVAAVILLRDGGR